MDYAGLRTASHRAAGSAFLPRARRLGAARSVETLTKTARARALVLDPVVDDQDRLDAGRVRLLVGEQAKVVGCLGRQVLERLGAFICRGRAALDWASQARRGERPATAQGMMPLDGISRNS